MLMQGTPMDFLCCWPTWISKKFFRWVDDYSPFYPPPWVRHSYRSSYKNGREKGNEVEWVRKMVFGSGRERGQIRGPPTGLQDGIGLVSRYSIDGGMHGVLFTFTQVWRRYFCYFKKQITCAIRWLYRGQIKVKKDMVEVFHRGSNKNTFIILCRDTAGT